MALVKLAALGAIGYVAYKYYASRRRAEPAAFASGQPVADSGTVPPVRDAGPGAMRDRPDDWTKTDENVDESFPASDPATTY